MGRFVKGAVVVLPFPFSDLSEAKRRPALVVADLTGDDAVLCQITSQIASDSYAIPLAVSDFTTGGLRRTSRIRPNRLFTADTKLVLYQAGRVTEAKLQEVIDKIVEILTS